MNLSILNTLRRFKYVYLHPHGFGDLIISMPYIRWIMEKKEDFALCVKDETFYSGFFKNFPFKDRVFGGVPSLYNKTQTIKSFKKLESLCRYFKAHKIKACYIKFTKDKDRRRQVQEELSRFIEEDLPLWEDVHGEVYISDREIDMVRRKYGEDFCFIHTFSTSFIKSVIPQRLKKFISPGERIFFPYNRDNININFAAQLLSKKNIVIDSVYMHSSGALKKDIDVLFVSMVVKRFISTLMPKNIMIRRILYGNIFDVVESFFYYNLFARKIKTKKSL